MNELPMTLLQAPALCIDASINHVFSCWESGASPKIGLINLLALSNPLA